MNIRKTNKNIKRKPKRKTEKKSKKSNKLKIGGNNFGPPSFNDPNFGGAYYSLNDYEKDLFGMTISSDIHGGGGSKSITSKKLVSKKSIKDFIISNYIKLKEKLKRKKDEILYNISKGDDGNDFLQIFKNGEKVFEFQISKVTIGTAFCYLTENFKRKDNHYFDIDEKYNNEIKNDLKNAIQEFNKVANGIEIKHVKDLPEIATSFKIDENTHMHKSLGLFRKFLFLNPVSIILTVIIWLCILISYIPLKIYCHNKLKNYTVKKVKSKM
jgi:hypothetical protein